MLYIGLVLTIKRVVTDLYSKHSYLRGDGEILSKVDSKAYEYNWVEQT